MTYLDHNATSVLRPEVKQAMTEVMDETGNPSSVHALGRKALYRMQTARESIANLVECDREQIIFTSCGTEANMLVVQGTRFDHYVSTETEHPSIFKVLENHPRIEVDGNGILDLKALEAYLKSQDGSVLISLIYANNETGVIQPIDKIVELAKTYKAYVHIDAVQALGKMPLSFKELDIDFMTIAPHKIGGPIGTAALIVKNKTLLYPTMQGGGQEFGYRSGTENVVAIYGFGKLADSLASEDPHMMDIEALRNEMETELAEFCQDLGGPEATFIAQKANRAPNVSYMVMPGVTSQQQLIEFDLKNIYVSSGSACTSGKVKASRVLKAMGISDSESECAIRVSLGWNTTKEDIKNYCECWKAIYARHYDGKLKKTA